jgi:hypothetical protein
MARRNESLERWLMPLALLGVTWMTWAVRDHTFFWDTVQLASRHGQWYFSQSFSQILLPDVIDSGHPPLFGMYIAFAWTLFAPSLVISHFAMLPFLWGIVWLLFRLGRYIGQGQWSWMPVLLVFADPVFLGQSVLVSPDIVLVFGFLMTWLGILERRPMMVLVGSLFLGLISTRGMICATALYVFSLFRERTFSWDHVLKSALPFVPAGLLAMGFLAYHYMQKGWVGYHPDMPWAPLFERASWSDLPRNFLVWGHRLVDVGRLFLWVALGWLVWTKGWRSFVDHRSLKELSFLFGIVMIVLSYPFFAHTGLHMHRYLLPLFLVLHFLFFRLLLSAPISRVSKKMLYILVILGLALGNRWVYPEEISQGWDSTLAHIPFYEMRYDFIAYMDEAGIALDQVGTAFPEIGPLHDRDLSGRLDGMVSKQLSTQNFILYTNVMNDFSPEEISLLRSQWRILKSSRKGGVEMILFARP